MKRTFIGVILLGFTLGALHAGTSPDALPTETFRGTVRLVTVGGVETPARKALAIGENRFEVVGRPSLVDELFSLEGHEVAVKGVVTNPVYIGGEGLPLLTLVAVERLCKCAPEIRYATASRLSGLARSRVLEVASRQSDLDLLTQPRVAGVRELSHREALVSVEWIRETDIPVVTFARKSYIYHLDTDRVDVVPELMGPDPGRIFDRARADALRRYRLVEPGQDPRIIDGIHPAIRETCVDLHGNITVTCELFGGIAGMSHGREMTYHYDRHGNFIRTTSGAISAYAL